MLRFEISRYFRRSVTLSTVYSHFVVPVHSFYLIYQFSSFHLPAYCPPFSDHFSQYFHLYCHICDIVPSPFYFSFSFLPRFFLFLFFLQMPPLHLSVLSYIRLSFSISHRPSHFCVKYITYLRSRTSPRANAGIISMQIHDRAHPRLNLISVNPIREGS